MNSFWSAIRISGRCRIGSGPDGTISIEKMVDFGVSGRGVIHRVQILDGGRCDYVFVRLGAGKGAVPVDGPGPRVVA